MYAFSVSDSHPRQANTNRAELQNETQKTLTITGQLDVQPLGLVSNPSSTTSQTNPLASEEYHHSYNIHTSQSIPYASNAPIITHVPHAPPFSNSTVPIHPIQFPRRQDLTPRPLSPNRQTHRMSPPSITPHIPQSIDVLAQFLPQITLDLHTGELGIEGEDGLGGEVSNSRGGEDAVFC